MAYTKTVWVDRVVQYPNRYKDQNLVQYTFTKDNGTVSAEGTPVNAVNLNNLEEGVYNAHTELALKAPIDSPTFTGTVALPSTTSIGNVSATELGYLDGVTSAIQTQINGKQATITGGATTIVSSNLTASCALVSDASGKVAVLSSVSSTELGYLDGVTSAIQTQLNAKAPLASPTFTGTVVLPATTSIGTLTSTEIGYLASITSDVQVQLDAKALKAPAQVDVTTSKTLALTDAGTVQECTSASAIAITVPPNSSVAFPIGTEIALIRLGAGTLSVVAGSGVTIQSSGSKLFVKNQYESACLRQTATNVWSLVGSLSAS